MKIEIDGIVEEIEPTRELIGDWRKWIIVRNKKWVSSINLPMPFAMRDCISTGGHFVRVLR